MSRLRRYLDQRLLARLSRRCAALVKRGEAVSLPDVRFWRQHAQEAQADLARVHRLTEARLNRVAWARQGAVRLPGVDWSWRPSLWTAPEPEANHIGPASGLQLGANVTLHHDCRDSLLCLRQTHHRGQGAAFAFGFEAYEFDGSYVSLVVDLPEEGAQGLMLRHLLRFDLVVEAERPNDLWARLNIRHGPNQEQLSHHLPINAGRQELNWDFDLGYLDMNEKRIEAVWLDLLFQPPRMNQIVLSDLMLSRRPRAAL